MKGLDTPILLRILRGEEKARGLIRQLGGEELVTTEWNFLELEAALRADSRPGRERRRAALEKLRRRLTVLPIDEASHRASLQVHGIPKNSGDLIELALLSTLIAKGCETMYSGRPGLHGRLRSSVRVQFV